MDIWWAIFLIIYAVVVHYAYTQQRLRELQEKDRRIERLKTKIEELEDKLITSE